MIRFAQSSTLICGLTAVSLIAGHASAQVNPKPAIIYIAQGEHSIGTIDFRDAITLSEHCIFCLRGEEEYRDYSPYDIMGFQVQDEEAPYVSMEVEDPSAEQYANEETPAIRYFLQPIIEDGDTLYFRASRRGRVFYRRTPSGTLVQYDKSVSLELNDHLNNQARRHARWAPYIEVGYGLVGFHNDSYYDKYDIGTLTASSPFVKVGTEIFSSRNEAHFGGEASIVWSHFHVRVDDPTRSGRNSASLVDYVQTTRDNFDIRAGGSFRWGMERMFVPSIHLGLVMTDFADYGFYGSLRILHSASKFSLNVDARRYYSSLAPKIQSNLYGFTIGYHF